MPDVTLTDEQLEELLAARCRSAAQRNAATLVLQDALDLVLADTPSHDGLLPDVAPQAPTLMLIASGDQPSSEQRRQLWPMLDAALERFGAIEVVTFGGQGSEFVAQKWARANRQPMREFAVLWNLPVGGGATARNRTAIRDRNRALERYIDAAVTPIAVGHGIDATPGGRRAQQVYAVLLKFGCYHQGRPVPPPVVAQSDDPGAVAAGAPDVPVSVAS